MRDSTRIFWSQKNARLKKVKRPFLKRSSRPNIAGCGVENSLQNSHNLVELTQFQCQLDLQSFPSLYYITYVHHEVQMNSRNAGALKNSFSTKISYDYESFELPKQQK